MKKTIFISFLLIFLISFGGAQAQTTATFQSTAPVISNVTSSTATISLPDVTLNSLTSDEKAQTYFEYYETQQVCIMIYPTPENCLPKKIAKGVLNTTLLNLKANTQYSVVYKRDNTIRCITTPCPGNEYQSAIATFTTKAQTNTTGIFSRNLKMGSKGEDVRALQNFLQEKGYFIVLSNGHFGPATRAAVNLYQRNDMKIVPTGTVGPLTRASLNGSIVASEETFAGKITSVSLGCFVDGECSVTVDGKKVVTTIGWKQGPVGTIRGTQDGIGSLEGRIGAEVKVYARKTTDGYTLYGSNNYYIELK